MELEQITREPNNADVFWTCGDCFFYRDSENPGLKANINAHLLQHRRIFIPDTSLLLNPLFKELVDQEPEYRTVLQAGDIVPILRPDATTFREVLTSLRKNANFIDPENKDNVDTGADFLDSTRPQVAASSPHAAGIMNSIGRNVLLNKEYWERHVHLQNVSAELVRYVPAAMKRNNAKRVRQTEFWEFAAMLADRGLISEAHAIRTELVLLSLASIAASLHLPSSIPAFATDAALRVFDMTDIRSFTPDGTWSEADDPDLITGSALLTPSQIYGIRASEEFRTYTNLLEGSDSVDAVTLDARRTEYLEWLTTSVKLCVTNRRDRWMKLKRRQRWIQRASSLSGILMQLLHSHTGADPIAEKFEQAALSGLLAQVQKSTSNSIGQIEREADAGFYRELSKVRRGGQIGPFLYGPTGPRSGRLVGDSRNGHEGQGRK